ncbi:MAG: hypothetical protein ACYCW6_11655 [Candidatus Xenobia bacterium]
MPEINPFSPPPTMAPTGSTPSAPQQAAPPPPPPPSAQPDQFTTSTVQDGPRQVTLRRNNYTGEQTRDVSGQNQVVVHQEMTPQGQTSFQATLPQGKLLPDKLEVSGNPQGQVEAHFASRPDQKFGGQRLPDGTVLIQVDPQRPLVMFNTESLDYGLATPRVQNGPNSEWQALREVVHADNSSTVIAGEQTTHNQVPVGPPPMWGPNAAPPQAGVVTDTQFMQFDQRNGQVTGKKVQARVMPGAQQQGPSAQMQVASFLMLGPLGPLLSRAWSGAGGSGVRETPLMVQQSPDGTLTPSAPTQGGYGPLNTAGLVDTYKQFYSHPVDSIKNFWGFGKSQQRPGPAPLQVQADPTLQPVKPFSAYGVLALWPGFANAPGPVASAMGTFGS